METEEKTKLKLTANKIRKNILEMLYLAGSGHTAGALGLADIYCVLYSKFLKFDKTKPKWTNRDYVIVSNGHTCPVYYATLVEFDCINKTNLKKLRKMGSVFQGHPHNTSSDFFENSGGSLGQGISQAVGLAVSLKRENKQNKVYCFLGDGELQEGQVWEALLFANKEKLNNLIMIVDSNNIQIDGTIEEVMPLEPLHKKFTSFGCLTIDFNGNNIEEINTVFTHINNLKDNNKPIVLIAKTIPGHPISFMSGKCCWHGKTPNSDEYKLALKELLQEISKLKI